MPRRCVGDVVVVDIVVVVYDDVVAVCVFHGL